MGFGDRSDSFDLNVALQDHFKRLKVCEDIAKEKNEPKQELDLKFKEGETIKINMKITVSIYFLELGLRHTNFYTLSNQFLQSNRIFVQ